MQVGQVGFHFSPCVVFSQPACGLSRRSGGSGSGTTCPFTINVSLTPSKSLHLSSNCSLQGRLFCSGVRCKLVIDPLYPVFSGAAFSQVSFCLESRLPVASAVLAVATNSKVWSVIQGLLRLLIFWENVCLAASCMCVTIPARVGLVFCSSQPTSLLFRFLHALRVL